jgi:peroxiredoxin
LPSERPKQDKRFGLKDLAFPVGGLLFGLFVGYLIFSGNAGIKQPVEAGPPEIGQLVSDFQLLTLDGNIISLSQYKNQAVMINFWGTWCPPCVQEMPLLQAVYVREQPELVILGVNEQDKIADVELFVADFGITFPILMDEDGVIAEQYLVRGFPTTFFIDKDGVLQAQHIGGVDEGLLSGYLAEIGFE